MQASTVHKQIPIDVIKAERRSISHANHSLRASVQQGCFVGGVAVQQIRFVRAHENLSKQGVKFLGLVSEGSWCEDEGSWP